MNIPDLDRQIWVAVIQGLIAIGIGIIAYRHYRSGSGRTALYFILAGILWAVTSMLEAVDRVYHLSNETRALLWLVLLPPFLVFIWLLLTDIATVLGPRLATKDDLPVGPNKDKRHAHQKTAARTRRKAQQSSTTVDSNDQDTDDTDISWREPE